MTNAKKKTGAIILSVAVIATLGTTAAFAVSSDKQDNIVDQPAIVANTNAESPIVEIVGDKVTFKDSPNQSSNDNYSNGNCSNSNCNCSSKN